jgi:hypothetical protein
MIMNQRSFGGALELIKWEIYERNESKSFPDMSWKEKGEYQKLRKVRDLLEKIRDARFIRGEINSYDAHLILCDVARVCGEEDREN